MLNILHCVLDDKFIDDLIAVMDTTGKRCNHYFAFISEKESFDYVYIKSTTRVDNLQSSEFPSYLHRNNVNVVIIHGIFSIPPQLVINIPPEIRVVWFAWGYDLYEPIMHHRSLIKIDKLYHFKTFFIKSLNYFFHIRGAIVDMIKSFEESYLEEEWRRIDYFSGIIPDEYDMIVKDKRNAGFKAKPLDFSYFYLTSNRCDDHICDPYALGNSIQIGNSGDETNNHLDVFCLLNKYDLGNKKIFAPISYSGSKCYRSAVCWYGHYLWKDNFVPIQRFMPREEYFKMVESVQYAIFYHERQQAMGNIYNALWNGCMVFISEKSPVYSFLKRCGYVFFTIQNDLYRIANNETLSDEERLHNRKVLIKYNSPQACLIKLNKIIDILDSDLAK